MEREEETEGHEERKKTRACKAKRHFANASVHSIRHPNKDAPDIILALHSFQHFNKILIIELLL